ncbi:MAG: TAXI family TRAP transporter solute-binding subunit [Rhodocyclaceae bacterium]|jgi:TRAP transporter TAXI family solute receptor|nr:TAXI family TRAP transporter solute-binding subunit [Rhodocyclaceae bacterium]
MRIRSLIAASALAIAASASHAAEFINVLTGGTSGVYYPLGVSLTQIYGKVMPDAKTSVQATKASAENLNLLQAGKGEVAFTLGDTLSEAWKGNPDVGFKAKLDKLRGLAAIYPNYIHFLASADSGITSLADLKGKKISVGAPKSGTELNSRTILKAAGLSYADLGKVEYLGYAESVELIKNRQLDATLLSSGLGVAAVRDLATAVKIVVIPIPADIVAAIGDAAYQSSVIPANTYNGQTADVPTIAVPNFLVTHAGVSEDTVYKMTKSMFENLDAMVAAHGAAKAIKKEKAATGSPVPLHPGAEKYYKEVGLLK